MEWPAEGSTSTRSPGLVPMGSLARASSSPWGFCMQPAQFPLQLRPHSTCRSRETSTTPSLICFFTIALCTIEMKRLRCHWVMFTLMV